nr:MAG TPA: hypothetical protein [Caudoviricetes sp.]
MVLTATSLDTLQLIVSFRHFTRRLFHVKHSFFVINVFQPSHFVTPFPAVGGLLRPFISCLFVEAAGPAVFNRQTNSKIVGEFHGIGPMMERSEVETFTAHQLPAAVGVFKSRFTIFVDSVPALNDFTSVVNIAVFPEFDASVAFFHENDARIVLLRAVRAGQSFRGCETCHDVSFQVVPVFVHRDYILDQLIFRVNNFFVRICNRVIFAELFHVKPGRRTDRVVLGLCFLDHADIHFITFGKRHSVVEVEFSDRSFENFGVFAFQGFSDCHTGHDF